MSYLDAINDIVTKRPKIVLTILVSFLVVLRLSGIFFIHLPLNIEEIQYAVWSQHVAFGYHSKPPLIAWVIALSSHWFSWHELARVRFFSPICYLITTFFIYMTSLRLFDKTTAIWSFISFYSLASMSLGSLLMTTDVLLLMCWSIALYFLVKALESEQVVTWALVGAFVGIGSLAKYTTLLFIPSLWLFLGIQKDKRYLLKTIKPYFVILLSFFVLLPNIVWNARHHFSSFYHVWNHNIAFSGFHLHVVNFLSFFFSQLGIFSPLLFFPLIFFIFFNFKNTDYKYNLLRCFSGVMLSAVFIQALVSNACANWAVSAYVSGVILMCYELILKKNKSLLLLNACVMLMAIIIFYPIMFIIGNDSFFQKHDIGGLNYGAFHKEITVETMALTQAYPNACFIFGDRYAWASFSYYGPLLYNKVYAYDKSDDFSSDAAHIFFPRMANKMDSSQYIYITRNIKKSYFLERGFSVLNLNASLKLPKIIGLSSYLITSNRSRSVANLGGAQVNF